MKWTQVSTKCFGLLGKDSKVCNGNGQCVDTDVCETGWVNDDCSIPQCIGKNATDLNVCSGRGACISKDSCKCNYRYTGNECTKYLMICLNNLFDCPNLVFLTFQCRSRQSGVIFFSTGSITKLLDISVYYL